MAEGFLSEREIEELQSWPSGIERSELVQWFTLDVADHRWVRSLHTDSNQLAGGIQLCALRYLGFFPDLRSTPPEIVEFIAEQLDIKHAAVPGSQIRQQQRRHNDVCRHADWAPLETVDWKRIKQWMTARAIEHDNPAVLFRQTLTYLRGERIVRPALKRLVRTVGTSRKAASAEIYAGMKESLTPERVARMDDLIETDPDLGSAPLVWLMSGETSSSAPSFKSATRKLEGLSAASDGLDVSFLPSDRRRHMAQIARKSTSRDLRDMTPQRRHPIIAAGLAEARVDAIDRLVLMFDEALRSIDSRTKNQVRDQQMEQIEDNAERLDLLDEMIEIALTANFDNATVGASIRALGLDRLQRAQRRPDDATVPTAVSSACSKPATATSGRSPRTSWPPSSFVATSNQATYLKRHNSSNN